MQNQIYYMTWSFGIRFLHARVPLRLTDQPRFSHQGRKPLFPLSRTSKGRIPQYSGKRWGTLLRKYVADCHTPLTYVAFSKGRSMFTTGASHLSCRFPRFFAEDASNAKQRIKDSDIYLTTGTLTCFNVRLPSIVIVCFRIL